MATKKSKSKLKIVKSRKQEIGVTESEPVSPVFVGATVSVRPEGPSMLPFGPPEQAAIALMPGASPRRAYYVVGGFLRDREIVGYSTVVGSGIVTCYALVDNGRGRLMPPDSLPGFIGTLAWSTSDVPTLSWAAQRLGLKADERTGRVLTGEKSFQGKKGGAQ
jgi:hypothetical protein